MLQKVQFCWLVAFEVHSHVNNIFTFGVQFVAYPLSLKERNSVILFICVRHTFKVEIIILPRYAGSEAHMLELMETVCDAMKEYGTTVDPETGRKGYTRLNTRPGETLTLSNVNLSSGGTEELTSAVGVYMYNCSLFIGP